MNAHLPVGRLRPAGITTAFSYDPDGRVIQTRQSVNGVALRTTATTYTLTGKPAIATDAMGNLRLGSLDCLAPLRIWLGNDVLNQINVVQGQLAILNPNARIKLRHLYPAI